MPDWLIILIIIVGAGVWFSLYARKSKVKQMTLEANLGNAQMQFELGRLYANGVGVKQDIKEAKKWLLKAARQGHPDACGVLSLFDDGEEDNNIKGDYMDVAEFPETETIDLFKIYTQQGEAEKLFNLGQNYEFGDGREIDYKKARECYEKAAQQGHVEAQFSLAQIYDDVDEEEQDYKKAAEWYEKAAQQGHEDAPYYLGLLYYYGGNGIGKDYKKAREWYEKGAKKGDAAAQFEIGKMYTEGLGVEQDYMQACIWFIIANANEFQNAKEKLKIISGTLTQKEIEKAKETATEMVKANPKLVTSLKL